MTSSTDRPAPLGAYLAMAAGLLALLSLALPWFRFDEVAFAEAMRDAVSRVMASLGDDLGGADAVSLQAMGNAATDAASVKVKALVETQLHGYQDNPAWVILRLLTIAGAFAAALRIMQGTATGESQRGVLLGIGVALAIRPVMTLFWSPFDTADTREIGLPMTEIIPPGSGIYVALLAAALMIGAGLLAHVGDAIVSAETIEHTAPMPAGPMPQAYMPGNAVAPAPAQAAYVPAPAQAAYAPAPAQAAYVPAPAQAAYAPAPPQPAYVPTPPQPAYAPSPPAHHPAAYVPAQSAFAPAPVAPAQQDAPRRDRSVAPPGLS